MIWFAIALVLFACGGVALWLSREPRRPAPQPAPHDEPENLFEPRPSRRGPVAVTLLGAEGSWCTPTTNVPPW